MDAHAEVLARAREMDRPVIVTADTRDGWFGAVIELGSLPDGTPLAEHYGSVESAMEAALTAIHFAETEAEFRSRARGLTALLVMFSPAMFAPGILHIFHACGPRVEYAPMSRLLH